MTDLKKYRWLMFFTLGAIYFLACIHRTAPTVIARDLMQAFQADAALLGLIASAYFFLYSAVQPPVGILSDTIGPKKVITIFTIVSAVGCVIFATSSSANGAVFGRALIGAGVGGIFIPSLKIFSRWYRADEFVGITGIMLAIGSVGGISATLPLTYLVLFFGWRVSFGVIGMLAMFCALICWFIIKDRPEDKHWRLPIENETLQETTKDPTESMALLKRLRIVFSNPRFWMITIASFFAGSTFLTFQGLWVVPYLIDVFSLSRAKAGGLLMVLPLGFSIGSISFGPLTARLGIDRNRLLLNSIIICIICWTILFFLNGQESYLFIIPLFLIMGISVGGILPILMTTVKELFPLELTGTAVGLMNPAAFLGTAIFQPFTGFLLDMIGMLESGAYPLAAYRSIFVVFLISFVITYFCAYLAFRKEE
ncbi:MAG: MFS transporter [Desulfobacterales bacterium]|nr:MFS transporter [Desulfobacterales bacterium]